MRAISRLSLLDGISTSSLAAMMPLRIRVRKSAMGSVIDMRSPARLRHAGDEALVRELAQADPADAELAVDRARTTAAAAARVRSGLVLRRALGADDLGGLGHGSPGFPYAATGSPARLSNPAGRPSRAKGMPIASSRANASASVVAVVVMVTSRPRTWSMAS